VKLSPKGLEALKELEGFRSAPYQCSARVWTIGYGSTHGVTKHTPPVSKEDAEKILRRDVAKFELAVKGAAHRKLTQGQFDALVLFSFNVGAAALRRSTLMQKLNAGDVAGAAEQFARWTKAGGKEVAGLTRRRKIEQEIFLS
jgi:lysozyme